MFGRLVTTLATVLAAAFVAAPATAADSSYAPRVTTTCQVAVRSMADGSFDVRVTIVGNASDPVIGSVRLDVTRKGSTVWSTRSAYANQPVVLHGPVVRSGSYRATATFRPSTGVYSGCSHSISFRAGVSAEHSGGGHNGGGNGGGAGGAGTGAGGLPNTGGPSVWWLLLGLTLVGAGGATVVASKREKVHVWR
jgi:LPXTG-motif cell wall-anchored protein